MPANPRSQPVQPPRLNNTISSAKYTNKDGSKFITIPKVTTTTASASSSETSEIMAPAASIKTNGQAPHPTQSNEDPAPAVNRKKQKRRQKQAEKLAAEAAAGRTDAVNGARKATKSSPVITSSDAQRAYAEFKKARAYTDSNHDPDTESYNGSDDEIDGYSETYEPSVSPPNGAVSPDNGSRSGKRKSKGKTAQSTQPPLASSTTAPASTLRMSKEKIWNTSSQEERERIKVFWLSLGDMERKSLVKVEKDAVLKKMKEQQRHSCSCTVCGRKRVAIEQELEVLYDAYYEELEQYANNQQGDKMPPMMAGSRRFGALSGLAPPNRLPPLGGRHPSRGRIIEHFGDEDDEGARSYDEGDEEGDYETESDNVDGLTGETPTDFFNFGQSLTVQGGILTVADDLLKNDGKKFIEMMEQLAERRMAKEEDAKENYNSNGYPNPATLGLPPHSHHHHHPPPPPEDEEEYDEDEEDDGDYDSEDDEYDEEDEEVDTMTEEQRMEEGRRMFQIFAARMFEQRVLTAYKEKVAAERQEKLLQELEEEDEAATLKKAKKAKEAQKKKEKAQQKKLALAEEKAKKDAEKAAEDAMRLAEEAKKAEEARARAEEKRKKREAQRKADEEERLRKEAEKQRRVLEARERQAELERKAREAKERDKREKEEARLREKEARDRENREKKEKLEREKREKMEAEAKAKVEKDAKEQQRRDLLLSRRPQQQTAASSSTGFPSGPGLPSSVTAKSIPKAPSPGRSGGLFFKDIGAMPQTPQFGAVSSQSASPNPSTPQTQNSPLPPVLQGRPPSQPFIHQPQAHSPMHSALKASFSAFQQAPFGSMQPMGNTGYPTGHNGFPSPAGFPPMNPSFGSRINQDQMFANPAFGSPFRSMAAPTAAPVFSGLPAPQGRGFPGQHGAPPGFPPPPMQNGFGGFPPGFGMHREPSMHSRQHSGSADKSPTEPIGTPITRPTPIRRPGSVSQGSQGQSSDKDVDNLTQHLGSSALLDDSDEPIIPLSNPRRASAAPASLGRHGGFAAAYGSGMDPSAFSSSPSGYNTWSGNPFASGSLPGPSYMGGWGNSIPSNGFGSMSGMSNIPHRTSQPRSLAVRLMLCRACKILTAATGEEYHHVAAVAEQLERLRPRNDPVVDRQELLDLCETEGNVTNGGGFFDVRKVEGHMMIKFDAEDGVVAPAVPGDIGSPIVGSAGMMNVSGSRFSPPGISAPTGSLGF